MTEPPTGDPYVGMPDAIVRQMRIPISSAPCEVGPRFAAGGIVSMVPGDIAAATEGHADRHPSR